MRECKDRWEEQEGASFSAKDTHLICMEKSISIHAGLRASCEWPPEGFNEGSNTNSGSP